MVKLKGNLYSKPIINQTLQTIGKNYTKNCPRCNENKFDVIMNYLTDTNHNNICFSCRAQAKILKKLLSLYFNAYEIDNNTVKQLYENVKLRKVMKNFFKGLALFGYREPFVMGAPLSVVWNITKNCNLKCSHCFEDSHYQQKSNGDLSTSEAKKVIRILAANDVITLNFSGGEPLMRKDLFELMRYAYDNEIYPTISTNGTLLTKQNCIKLSESGVSSVTISLDSISSENHDRLRNVKGAYALAIKGIKNAAEVGKFKELIISTTLTDYNYKEIPQIYEYIQELGATRYYVGRLLPNGRGKNYMDHDPSKEIKRELMDFLAKKLIQSVQDKIEIPIITRGMPYFSKACYELSNGKIYPVCELITGYEPELQKSFNNKSANFIQKIASTIGGCASGLFYIGLDNKGQVQPCATSSHIKLGNILTQGLHDIWINNPMLNTIREQKKEKKGKCSTCNAKEFCGGCLVSAYGSTGDWHESDTNCPY